MHVLLRNVFIFLFSPSSELWNPSCVHSPWHLQPLSWKRNLSPMLTFALHIPWRPRHPSFWFPMVSITRTRTELPNKHILNKHLFVLDWMLKKMCQFVLKRIVQPQGQTYKRGSRPFPTLHNMFPHPSSKPHCFQLEGWELEKNTFLALFLSQGSTTATQNSTGWHLQLPKWCGFPTRWRRACDGVSHPWSFLPGLNAPQDKDFWTDNDDPALVVF